MSAPEFVLHDFCVRGLSSSASSRRSALAIGGAYPGARKGSIAMAESALRAIWTCRVGWLAWAMEDLQWLSPVASHSARSKAPMRAPGHRSAARQQGVRGTTTYFARNLAHDLSCSFTNTLPFEEESRSGGPKGSQACAARPAGRSKSGAPLAAQLDFVLAALDGGQLSGSRHHHGTRHD